jgi:hypothetical protein
MSVFTQVSIAQAKAGLETYSFHRDGQSYVWMPVIHYESGKGTYAEMRYNYEDINTASIFLGKSFHVGSNRIDVKPMIGISAGHFNGISFALNADAEMGSFFWSCESQFSIASKKSNTNFFFNWSEAGINVTKNLFAGLSYQYTIESSNTESSPGILAGVSFGNITIPFYLFQPFSNNQLLVLGFNYEYKLKNRHKQ